jgi:hypothetical protein
MGARRLIHMLKYAAMFLIKNVVNKLFNIQVLQSKKSYEEVFGTIPNDWAIDFNATMLNKMISLRNNK